MGSGHEAGRKGSCFSIGVAAGERKGKRDSRDPRGDGGRIQVRLVMMPHLQLGAGAWHVKLGKRPCGAVIDCSISGFQIIRIEKCFRYESGWVR